MARMIWESVWLSIQNHLKSTSAHIHAPPGFDGALFRVLCESKESPERRLLEHSVFAWVALVSNKSVRAGFNQLSPSNVEGLLKHVQKLRPSAATKDRIRRMFTRRQRQEQLKEAGLERLLDFEHAEAQEKASNHTASPEMETPHALSKYTGRNYTPAKQLHHIFHPRMCDRILKDDGGAAVTILDAADLAKWRLRIGILRESIPNLAIRLFGCTLVETSTGWVLQVEQGPDVELKDDGSFRFSRASVDAVGLFIGTPIRELVDRGDEMTTLLSLSVRGGPNAYGKIEVEAHADELETIASKLWPYDT